MFFAVGIGGARERSQLAHGLRLVAAPAADIDAAFRRRRSAERDVPFRRRLRTRAHRRQHARGRRRASAVFADDGTIFRVRQILGRKNACLGRNAHAGDGIRRDRGILSSRESGEGCGGKERREGEKRQCFPRKNRGRDSKKSARGFFN